jgi:hypothetical protein
LSGNSNVGYLAAVKGKIFRLYSHFKYGLRKKNMFYGGKYKCTYVEACCSSKVSLHISLDDYYEIQDTTLLEDFPLVSMRCSMGTGEHPPI